MILIWGRCFGDLLYDPDCVFNFFFVCVRVPCVLEKNADQ